MIRRILVPIDAGGSECAVRYAEMLARDRGASLRLLGVIDSRGISRAAIGAGAGSGHYAREVREHHLDHARQTLGKTLDETARRLREGGLSVESSCEIGSVSEHVLRASLVCDLIVVARNANFRFETEDEPGRELHEILLQQARPTIVVSDEFRPVSTVTVAHDLSVDCARTLFVLLQLDLFPGARLIVVHADPDGAGTPDDWRDGPAYLKDHGRESEFVVRNLEPAEALLEVVRERDADLLVLGPYRKGSVRQLLLGSVGAELLTRANVPILFGI